MTTPLTFTRAKAAAADFLCVAGVPDGQEPFTPFTRLCRYDAGDAGPVKWFYDDLQVAVTSIARFTPAPGAPTAFCVLSAEGDVVLMRPPFPREKIPGAGITSPDAERWGRLARLRPVGDHLYACGDGGQVYRRVGGDFGAGRWEHLDRSLLQDPEERARALLHAPSSPAAEHKVFYCVDGPREDEIYVTGTRGTILVWDGATFTALPPVTAAALVSIFVEDEKRIWICGREGTLLRGNRREGFRAVAVSGRRQMFTSITRHDGRIYLASGANPRGLFTYERGSLRRVSTGLVPEIEDAHTVDSVGGALWVVGSKDIVRLEGSRWERIDHVDNAPIR
ncbi:hypothetical protein WMF11_31330 [Sorangium sp. So ce295]|uniref:hypothetical protein n=1 Tax=Sorangium sp. So ce295 TaxID=3133295 RepID=UPI003F5E83D2